MTEGRRRQLLIKRGHEPGASLRLLPGGRIEPAEIEACALAARCWANGLYG